MAVLQGRPRAAMAGDVRPAGPLIFAAPIATLFGAYEPGEASFFAIPEIIFEAGITIYTIWKAQAVPILDDSRYARMEQASGREALAVP
jgi:hypothetical protein